MQPSASEQEARRAEQELVEQIVHFFKVFGLVAAIWLIGYLGFSITWLLVAVLAYAVTSYTKAARQARTEAAQAVARNERKILASMDNLPSWVFFPDVERAEWLNAIVKQAWPYIKDYAVQLIETQIVPGVKKNLPDIMQSFQFTRLDLGDIAPRIGGIKVYTGGSVRRSEIVMDLDIVYYGDANIVLKFKGFKAGLKSVELRGTLRVVIAPLIARVPIASCISLTFLSVPDVNFDLTDLGNVLDLPGLRQLLVKVVTDQISSLIVVPKRLVVPLVSDLDLTMMRWQLPEGVLRFKVLEARDLKRSDVSLFNSGKSDPYAKVAIGSEQFATKVVSNSVNPVWNAAFEAPVEVRKGQLLEIELFDKDPGSKDDPLGSARVDLASVAADGVLDTWLRLEDVDTGSVRLRLCWANLLDVAAFQPSSSGARAEFSPAFLYVGVDSCRCLPSVKHGEEPSALVEISIVGGGGSSGCGGAVQRTDTVESTPDPVFDKPFHMFVSEPAIDILQVRVLHRGQQRLGELQVPLRCLLQEKMMQLSRAWNLSTGSSFRSQIVLHLALRAIVEGKAQPPAELPAPSNKEEPDTPSTSQPPAAAAAAAHATDVTDAAADADALTAETKSTAVTSTSSPPAAPVAFAVANESDDDSEDGGRSSSAATSSAVGAAAAAASATGSVRLRKTASSSRASKEERQQQQQQQQESSSQRRDAGPRVQLTLRYSRPRQCLVIAVHRAEGLPQQPSEEHHHPCDPYAKLHLKCAATGRAVSKKQKTKAAKATQNPVYDESFDFALAESELPQSALCVQLLHQSGKFSRPTLLGAARIDLANFSHNATVWYDLVATGGAADD